jgi:hypothetical protein
MKDGDFPSFSVCLPGRVTKVTFTSFQRTLGWSSKYSRFGQSVVGSLSFAAWQRPGDPPKNTCKLVTQIGCLKELLSILSNCKLDYQKLDILGIIPNHSSNYSIDPQYIPLVLKLCFLGILPREKWNFVEDMGDLMNESWCFKQICLNIYPLVISFIANWKMAHLVRWFTQL